MSLSALMFIGAIINCFLVNHNYLTLCFAFSLWLSSLWNLILILGLLLFTRGAGWPLFLGGADSLAKNLSGSIWLIRLRFVVAFLFRFLFWLTLFLLGLAFLLLFEVLLLLLTSLLGNFHERVDTFLRSYMECNLLLGLFNWTRPFNNG